MTGLTNGKVRVKILSVSNAQNKRYTWSHKRRKQYAPFETHPSFKFQLLDSYYNFLNLNLRDTGAQTLISSNWISTADVGLPDHILSSRTPDANLDLHVRETIFELNSQHTGPQISNARAQLPQSRISKLTIKAIPELNLRNTESPPDHWSNTTSRCYKLSQSIVHHTMLRTATPYPTMRRAPSRIDSAKPCKSAAKQKHIAGMGLISWLKTYAEKLGNSNSTRTQVDRTYHSELDAGTLAFPWS